MRARVDARHSTATRPATSQALARAIPSRATSTWRPAVRVPKRRTPLRFFLLAAAAGLLWLGLTEFECITAIAHVAQALTSDPRSESAAAAPGNHSATSFAIARSNDSFADCVRRLVAHDESGVRRTIQSRYRLTTEDVTDAVREALISVCLEHTERSYSNVSAAFQTAAANRAKDILRRGRFAGCPLNDEIPSCGAMPDDGARLESEWKVIEMAYCAESATTQDALRRWGLGESNASVGASIGMSADEARTLVWNAIARIRKRYSDLCNR